MSFLQIPIGTYPNTFLGYQSSVSMTTGGQNTAFGFQTLNANTTGDQNAAFGHLALSQNTTGRTSVAMGFNALFNQTTGFENVAIGHASAGGLTTGQGNIAIGAGASVGNLGSSGNITIGRSAGYVTTVNECVLIGNDSGNVNQGSNNTFIGTNSGGQITTGAKNTIVGSFRGNQFGLDIRTLSNHIVLSDGDGNPRLWINNTGAVNIPGGFVLPGGTANGVLYLNGSNVVTSGSALTFDGTNLGIGTSSPAGKLDTRGTAYLGADANNALVVESTSSLVTIAAAGRTAFSTSALRFLTSDGTAALERMRLDSSGNLGLGVTPSAWSGLAPALQVQRASIVTSSASAVDTSFSSNAFYDGGWKYILSAPATQYLQNISGDHRWRVAASGTAGNAISFTQAMTLDASGNLGIGTTSTASGRLTVDSNSGIPSLLLTNSSTGNPYLSFQSGGFIQDLSGGSLRIRAATASGYIDFDTNATRRFRIDDFGNSIFGTAAIATNATNGFVYVPTCAGTPTGTPTTYTGTAPIVVDTTNNKLYFYSGGAWRDAGP